MINFKEFITEENKEPQYHAFDLDGVLGHTDDNKLRIHVMDSNGKKVKTLTNSEFNTHHLPDGHSYDFSEFRSSDAFAKHTKPIKSIINKLNKLHGQNHKVEIVTARADLDDQKRFAHHMKKMGIDVNEIHVRRSGNLNPKNAATGKKEMIKDMLSKSSYKKAHLYDDSPDNLEAFLSLHKQFPDTEFHAHHVNYNPKKNNVTITTTTASKASKEEK